MVAVLVVVAVGVVGIEVVVVKAGVARVVVGARGELKVDGVVVWEVGHWH